MARKSVWVPDSVLRRRSCQAPSRVAESVRVCPVTHAAMTLLVLLLLRRTAPSFLSLPPLCFPVASPSFRASLPALPSLLSLALTIRGNSECFLIRPGESPSSFAQMQLHLVSIS